jgi:hypothetical protein
MFDIMKEIQEEIREQVKKAWLDGFDTGCACCQAAGANQRIQAEEYFDSSDTYQSIRPKKEGS